MPGKNELKLKAHIRHGPLMILPNNIEGVYSPNSLNSGGSIYSNQEPNPQEKEFLKSEDLRSVKESIIHVSTHQTLKQNQKHRKLKRPRSRSPTQQEMGKNQQIKREGTCRKLLGIKAQSNNVKSHGMVSLVDLTKLERQLQEIPGNYLGHSRKINIEKIQE